jgi:hypothetical protein
MISLHSCCSSQQFSENPPLENTEWVLSYIIFPHAISRHEFGAIISSDTNQYDTPDLLFLNKKFQGISCNDFSGDYFVSGNRIVLSNLKSTNKYCGEYSLEKDYFKLLTLVYRYKVNDDDELLFYTLNDSAQIIYKPFSQ